MAAAASTAKVNTGVVNLPGVSYLPDKIEIELDDEIVQRVELEFLDFLRSLTDLMKLMHIIKAKHLRNMTPIPPAVIREIMVVDTTGPKYKAWDKLSAGAMPGITASAANLFKGHQACSIASLGAAKQTRPVLRKEQMKKKTGLEADLIEITGKRTKPLWHVVALEAPQMEIMAMNSNKGRLSDASDTFHLAHLIHGRSRPIHRSRSDQLLVNIKSLLGSGVRASSPTFQDQMDMLLAKDAGFTSVADHKAYLDTQKPHWYKDLLMDTHRMGILYSLEIVEAFESLGKYYETSSTSIPLARAKMCYLLQSLPVWDVCQAAFQRAFDFFLHVVLEVPEKFNTQSDWLKARKLPYLVHEPLTAEMVFLAKNPSYNPQSPSPQASPRATTPQAAP